MRQMLEKPCPLPGVLEQVLDCSGGDDITEESGRQRKLDALLQLLRTQVMFFSIRHGR